MLVSESKDVYMVLGYACNHRCRCCPCSKEQSKKRFIPTELLYEDIEKISQLEVTDVALSGGEPTLHPDFLQIVEILIKRGIHVHLLSNGDRFSDLRFSDDFIKISHEGKVSVTTTFHSHTPIEHEKQNGSSGSFERSLSGVRYLDQNGIDVSIKHCITQSNYTELKPFIEFALLNFTDNAEIQLWGIDLSGIDPETAMAYYVDINKVKPYLEMALDYFASHTYGNRIININNIPLCACDCFYWKYFSQPNPHGYVDYKNDTREIACNSGPVSVHCSRCHFRHYCTGTYTSTFDLFGDDVVHLPVDEMRINSTTSVFARYDDNSIYRLYFSPYNEYSLTTTGLVIINRLTGGSVNMHLSAGELIKIIDMFCNGIKRTDAAIVISKMKNAPDAERLLDELLFKGVLE